MHCGSEILIGDRLVSAQSPTYFIADIAANHDGDLGRAKDLIWLAKEAGAEAAKFQHFLAGEIVSDHGFKTMGGQQSHQSTWEKSVFEVYEQYHCPRDWTEELRKTCADASIHFMTTPYDAEAVDMFANIVPAFKIGSGDITWLEFIEKIASKDIPVFLACGASDMAEVEDAVATILACNPKLVLMQCNTNYTGDIENFKYINLRVLRAFAEKWPDLILGLSDHSFGHASVLGAVTMGARVVEKHFTDDNSRTGPDHHFAMNPKTWREMIDRTRELEATFGDGIKRVEGNETDTLVIQRRAIRLKEDLPAGTVLDRDHLKILRPCPSDAISPRQLSDVLGKPLRCAKNAHEHLTWPDINSV